MVFAVVALICVGIAAARVSQPFVPQPSLWPARCLVTALAVSGAVMLGVSLTFTWWIVHDWEREDTLVTRGDARLVQIIVVAGLACVLLTIRAVWGRRNWTPLGLILAWPILGFGWFASTGESVDSDASGEAGTGLSVATWALLLITIAAVLGSFERLAEHRAHRRQHADRAPS